MANKRTIYHYNCVTCKEPFDTLHSFQRYCNRPCKPEYKNKGKRGRPKAEGTADQRKKIEAEKRRKHTLTNRKYLTMKL